MSKTLLFFRLSRSRAVSSRCILAATLMVAFATSGAAQSFRSSVTYPTTTYPNSIAVGDYNRDGFLDLAIPHFGGPVVIMLGDGLGRFTPGTTYSAGPGSGPRASIATDLNQDGKLDLVVSNQENHAVSVFIGDGAGHFANYVRYPVGTLPYFLSTADFNEDGFADIAVANSGSANISVLLGDGAGHFLPQTTYPAGATTRSVVPADFNGDGHIDLAAANYDADTVSIYMGQGNGQFSAGGTLATAGGPYLLAAGDLNGDGRADLVIPNFDVGSISIFLGSSTGDFIAGPTISTGKSPRHASIADVNGDTRVDLVVANRDASTLSVLLGDGSGGFSTPVNIGVASGPFSTQIRDFDRDGHLDLAVVERDAGSISTLLGEGTGAFPAPISLPTGGSPRALTAADFDGDGRMDLAFANNYTKTVTVLMGDGQGGASHSATYDAGRGPYGIAAADLNGDALADLVVANASNNNVSVLLGTGAGNFGAQRFFTAGGDPRSVAAADFTGDGHLDLVVANYQANSFSFLRNLGSGTFAASVNTPAGTNPSTIIAADFDADGLQDVAVANSANVMILRGNGAGGFLPPITLTTGINPSALSASDVDADGHLDLLVTSFSANTVTLFKGNGIGQFTSTFVGSVEAGPFGVGSADFDGDGRVDIAVVSATVSKVNIFKGTETGFLPRKIFSGGLYSRALAIADFNQDQKPDIAITNSSADDGWILLNTSGVGDVSVSIDDHVSFAPPGTILNYLIVVSNHGPSSVTGAAVATSVPPTLTDVTWTCSPSPGSACAASGSGSIADTVTVADHGAVAYALVGTVAPLAGGILTVSASVTVPPPGVDSMPSNNGASDTDGVGENHVPVADSQTVSAVEDTPMAIVLVATDPDNDPLTWSIVTQPAHGTLSGSAASWTYTPAANFTGTDAFSFTVRDGFVDSNIATVTIAVAGVNDVPSANLQSVTVNQGGSVGIELSGADVDNDVLTFSVSAQPAHGSLSGSGANLTYVPQPSFSGSDAFTFTVYDGQATSAAATVSITVIPVNAPPSLVTPVPDLSVTDQSTSAVLNLGSTFTDPDLSYGDALTLSVVSNTNSSLVTPSFAGAVLTLGLAPGANGTAVLVVRATDSHGLFVEDSFTVTITRPALAVSIAGGSVLEVNSGPRALTMAVTLSAPAPAPVTVTYTTSPVTALAGVDYVSATGTVTFATGATTQTITVNTLGDVVDEADETFTVLLSNPVGATIADGEGLASILDNDQSALSVNDVSVTETDGGIMATFTVSMTAQNSRPVTVEFATANGTALAGFDYMATSGVLTFTPGVTVMTVSVPVLGDTLDELTESLSLNLANPAFAILGRSKGYASIVDDDLPPSVTIGDVSIGEAHSVVTATLTLTLSAPSGQTVRVQFTTADGTAVAGSDYQTRFGEIQFGPGVLTRTIPITIVGDHTAEPSESFVVNLTSGTAVTIVDSQAVITIVDDDGAN